MRLREALNIEYLKVVEHTLEAKMNLTEFHTQNIGFLHGGATIAFGEQIAGVASSQLAAEGLISVGQTITASHVRPKPCRGYVIAKGRLIRAGKRSHVWVIDVCDEEGEIISHLSVTNVLIRKPGV